MKPTLLHYYLTNRCNSKCVFCTIWQEKPKKDALESDVLNNLQQARQAGCSFVDFTGGEPLLHPLLPKFLQEAKRLGYITSVTTNCILFEQRAAELSGLIDLLHFSFDSDSAERHNALRGADSYAAVLKSITCARKYKLFPDLLFTYTNDNIDDIDGVYRIAQENKLVLLLDPVFDPWAPDKIAASTHLKAIAFSIKLGVYLNRAHLLLRSVGGNHNRKPLCRAVSTTIVVLPDNNLALPCFHHRSATIPINNDLCRILATTSYKNFKENQGKFAFCESCHINCYFDPSYTFLGNKMTIYSIRAKVKYFWTKYILYRQKLPTIKFFKRF